MGRSVTVPTDWAMRWLAVLVITAATAHVRADGPAEAPASHERVFQVEADEAAIARWKANVAYLMSLSEEEVIAMVPTSSGGLSFTDCPNCDHGTQDRGPFLWKPEQPQRLECRACGAVYPDNPDYPDDQYLEVKAPQGTHRFHYYERPDGYRIFFRARADYSARLYLERQARDLGELYRATGDDAYARRAAVIMHRFAQVYPGYVYKYDYPFHQTVIQPYDQNRVPNVPATRTSRWSWWRYIDISSLLLQAFEALEGWDGWDEVAAEGKPGARQQVREDLLEPMAEFVLGFEEPFTNMSIGMWRDIIYAGRVLDRPEWVHEAVGRFEQMLGTQFLYDGHWYETSPSYHQQVIVSMDRVMQAAQGYSDPPGYAHPETGRRFDELNLRDQVPQYAAALVALDRPQLPDGRLIPINDTWAIQGKIKPGTARTRSESFLMPGLGLGVLAGGEDDAQFMAWLNYTGGRHHKHQDALSIGLYANGHEGLPDRGYTHTRYRVWANSTMSHNTVVLDGREGGLDPQHTGHAFVAYADAGPAMAVVSAESAAAYPERTSRYRRTLVKLGRDAHDTYLVDLFEVHGGTQHDYLLHGSADEPTSARVEGAALQPFEGTLMNKGVTFDPPRGEHDPIEDGAAYAFVKSLRAGDFSGDVVLDLRLADTPGNGIRTVVLAGSDGADDASGQVFLGEAPSIRPALESETALDDAMSPFFCVRLRGDDLTSRFIAVHEPVHEDRWSVTEVARELHDDVLLVRVNRGSAGTDYVLIALEGAGAVTLDTPDGPLTFEGRYGSVRVDGGGRPTDAALIGGTQLSLGDWRISGHGTWSGEVAAVSDTDDAYIDVHETVDGSAVGALVLTFADGTSRAFNVTRVEPLAGDGSASGSVGGSRLHVRESLGFHLTADQVVVTSFPQRTIEGSGITYRLPGVKSYER